MSENLIERREDNFKDKRKFIINTEIKKLKKKHSEQEDFVEDNIIKQDVSIL